MFEVPSSALARIEEKPCPYFFFPYISDWLALFFTGNWRMKSVLSTLEQFYRLFTESVRMTLPSIDFC